MDGGGAAAPPFCAVSAPPQPVCEVGPLGGHRAPSAGKTQHRAQQIRVADRGALHPGAFWTAPRAVPPGWGETQTDFGPPPPGARRFTQLWNRRSHPRGSVALQARSSVALSAPATDRIGAGNHLLSRQPPGSSRASPGRNHPLGQATTYWGRKFAYPNAQFPTPMPGPGAGGARSPVWRSKMRLSSRLERGLVERMVQNASESARIRPDPAQIAKLRRILDRPTRKMLHPVVESALPPPWFGGAPGARFGGAFRARARSHRGRQPPI